MTSQGSAYHRFRRALDRSNHLEALSATSELKRVGIVEALELVLLLTRAGDERCFPSVAVRWLSRGVLLTGCELEPVRPRGVS